MKRILNEKGHLIARCIVFQIAMSLLGFFVISAVANSSKTIVCIAGIFTACFYYAIMGASLNEDGLKDQLIASRSQYKGWNGLYGMKYVAISYIPTFILTLAIIILRSFDIAYKVADALVLIVKFFFTGMYFGIDMSLFITGADANGFAVYSQFSNNGFSLIIYQIASVIICGLFYYLGFKGINLLGSKDKKQ